VPRHFNTSGPCRAEIHYMLPALRRLPEMQVLVEQQKYFVVHAPRQVGKTTALASFARELTESGQYAAVLLSMETGSQYREDVGAAEAAILTDWRRDIRHQLPAELQPPPFPQASPGAGIGAALDVWAAWSPRPIVVFLDEIDSLRDRTLVSVLRQLRSGYRSLPEHFPWSLALIGLRDVRDYKVSEGEREYLGTASPFNIKARSLTLRDFTAEEVVELYAQHTADTGQVFTAEASALAFALTQGQPWLVNALAAVVVGELVRDRGVAIGAEHVEAARRVLIARQETHLDSLAERLREPRVRAIVEPMLAGAALADLPPDDVRYAIDLGLLRMSSLGGLEVSNPIYREVIVKELSFVPRASLPMIQPTWLTPAGRLDAGRLLQAFLAFWRRHGEAMLGSAPYHEVAPHLVLMAFLDRVANGGGTIDREYAIGRGRMDLCLRLGPDALGIELKVWRDGRPDPVEEGLEQLDGYLAGIGESSGWLVIFDRRGGQPLIEARTSAEPRRSPEGREVMVVRA
jgi:hypothetical protein